MSNEFNNRDKKPNQSIDKEVIPKDEVSYTYGFKTIIKHDMVGKALVMSMRKHKDELDLNSDKGISNG